MANFCKSCGTELTANSQKCPKCGIQENKYSKLFLENDEEYVDTLGYSSGSVMGGLIFWGEFESELIILSNKRIYYTGSILVRNLKSGRANIILPLSKVTSFGMTNSRSNGLLVMAIFLFILGLVSLGMLDREKAISLIFFIPAIIALIAFFLSIRNVFFIATPSSTVTLNVGAGFETSISRFAKSLGKLLDK